QGGVTLYCGDCRNVVPSLQGYTAIVTDPPYGVGKQYGEGFVDSLAFFQEAISLVASLAVPSAVHIPVPRLFDLPVKPQWVGVWDKMLGMSGLIAYPIYPHWEPIAFYHIKGDYAGNKGHRSDVFHFAPAKASISGHPTPKPLPLVRELIRFLKAEVT